MSTPTARIPAGVGEILAVWRRRRHLAIPLLGIGIAACAGFVKALPDLYRSTATVLVQRDEVTDALLKSASRKDLDVRLKTINQEVLSRGRLQELIERFGLYSQAGASAPARLRREIQMKVDGVEPGWGRDSTIAFSISYQGTDPQLVSDVTNAVAELYLQENEQSRKRLARGTTDALSAQIEDVRSRLEGQERQIARFKQAHLGQLPDQLGANLRTLERLSTELRVNGDRRIRLLEMQRELERTWAQRVEAPSPGEGPALKLGRMNDELLALRARGFSPTYPDVVQLEREIAMLKQLHQDPDSGAELVDPREPLHAELRSLDQKAQQLRLTMDRYQNAIDRTPERDIELQELTRDYATTKDLYHSLLLRDDEARLVGRVEQGLPQGGFRILDAAKPETVPSAPARLKLLLGGLMLAVVFAVVAVVLAEYLDSSFHDSSSLRAFTRVPILGSVPRIVATRDLWRGRLRTGMWLVGTGAGIVLIALLSYQVALENDALTALLSTGTP